METNAKSVIDLAAQCKKAGVRRFIFPSSRAVYWETRDYFIDEEHPVNPRTVYGRSKLEAEQILGLAGPDFTVVILRPSNVYGHGLFYKGNTVVDKFIERFIDREPIEIAGDGGHKRNFVHLQDMINIYHKIAVHPSARSGIFNIGASETISIQCLAIMVNEIGQSVFGYDVPIKNNIGETGISWHDYEYVWRKAQMEFQYRPYFTLDDYIKERFFLEMRNF